MNNHHLIYSVKFHRKSQITKLAETMTTIKLLFSLFKISFFKDSLFPSAIVEWNKVDLNFRNSTSPALCKRLILKFIRPGPTLSLISIRSGLKLITKLHLGLSHLNYHKFGHDSQDCINPICSCGHDIKTATYFLFHCHHYTYARQTLFNKIINLDLNILEHK